MSITNLISIIAAGLLLAQLVVIYIAYKADNERKKKQSTIEYINQIRSFYKPIRNKLDRLFPDKDRVINLEDIDDNLKGDIKELLSIIEHLSVGLNTNVYDFDIFFRMSGSYFLRIFYKLQPYISDVQRRQNTAYIEYEAICERIKKAKEKHNYKISITKSRKMKFS